MASNNPTGLNPTRLTLPRSVFPINKRHPTTIALGHLIPIMVKEILPGDTITLDLSSVIRNATPFVNPVYGDLMMDAYAFFVPNRLIWDHWFQFCGENDKSAWTQKNKYLIPKQRFVAETDTREEDTAFTSIGNYLGLPFVVGNSGSRYEFSINELPLRGYVRIWNEYFRDQNYQNPLLINFGDESNENVYSWDQPPLVVNKYHDYFTNVLPEPQKGSPVNIPLGSTAPVVLGDNPVVFQSSSSGGQILRGFTNNGGSGQFIKDSSNAVQFRSSSGSSDLANSVNVNLVDAGKSYVDLANATAATINAWRIAFQTQVFEEVCARYGTRYNELVLGLFGVETGDTRAYRTELLGGIHIPLNMQEVVATSSSADNSSTEYALGQQVVKLANADHSSLFTKSFKEHGYLYVMVCIRAKQQYFQGIERMWKRDTFLDFYNRIFDNIGETPVYESEVNCANTGVNTAGSGQVSYDKSNDKVFGYQEAWADYRYEKDLITGYFRPFSDGGLPTFSFAQELTAWTSPIGLIPEDRARYARTTALTNLTYDFVCDFMITGKIARVMSVRSVPGLIDHHGV